ncbi:glutathione S-transferase [Alteromonas sp. KUL17]|uniref:glutathione S-transferase family protein n=1 Tax=Alteromonas sp. KUL17 TaxID=2480796 RepID=UPI00103772B4|nr:glutathione S-transferase [Alteromonas sp. KUL17]TAP25366.1 glutathione S-transferase [Alteromonas sp. KUL17]GEA03643.1 glutathione S-transferase [Alteromonas sp. KUL17]
MDNNFPADHAPIKLYRNPLSGHCHRVELMLSLLGLPYENIDLDMANGAHKSPEYLKISPFGQVPAIDDNGYTMSDSNAIITYLVKRYSGNDAWLPEEPAQAAEVQRWLSVAAGEIMYGPCTVRLVKLFGMDLDYSTAEAITHKLFSVLEKTLAERSFLAGNQITLADIAGYSYISHVPEGGVSLDPYPAIEAWLARIEAQPKFVGMKRSKDLTK